MEISIKATTPYYIWRTQGDDKVRASHAANNGKVFAWAHPPATGNPGEAPHCRCWAEPYTKVPTVAEMGLLLAGTGLIRVGGPVGRVIGGRVIQRVSGDLVRRVRSGGGGILRRPDKVPKDWIEKPTKDGNDVQYVDPKNAYNEVRVKKEIQKALTLGSNKITYMEKQRSLSR